MILIFALVVLVLGAGVYASAGLSNRGGTEVQAGPVIRRNLSNTVSATGETPLRYQWSHNDETILSYTNFVGTSGAGCTPRPTGWNGSTGTLNFVYNGGVATVYTVAPGAHRALMTRWFDLFDARMLNAGGVH